MRMRAHGTRTLPTRPRCQTPLATDESSGQRRRASQSQVGRAGLVTSNRRLGMRDPRVTGTAGRDILGESSALEVDGSPERITVDLLGVGDAATSAITYIYSGLWR